MKGKLQGTAARQPFDAITERVAAPNGVSFRPGKVGGIPGVWCTPPTARTGEKLLHLHGGWFTWGTAHAFRNLVGHIAMRAEVEAFVPDYRLAPEHPFRAGSDDARACSLDLAGNGGRSVVVTGDSAGGGLALSFGQIRQTSSGRGGGALTRDRLGTYGRELADPSRH